jgi:hypothetical protein
MEAPPVTVVTLVLVGPVALLVPPDRRVTVVPVVTVVTA